MNNDPDLVCHDLKVTNNLWVQGTTATVNMTTVNVESVNIEHVKGLSEFQQMVMNRLNILEDKILVQQKMDLDE